ncbi:Phage tail sheath protein [Sodalis glossinidius str. 'morsitans']|uniref:Phage tail sheath protein n=1 Tax=Sodalis glossinidius (strain morsitans) TaxID=343509 RepID=A0A193QGV7_SODGM|nr:Phage tail sheath protein [Sodalis glossinidius str. 'morsitans']CRL44886.1 Phage tail sheath protein [Sodalis glossinidius str. 'morsitans']CRL46121.1 Phage tail sheath protein [Sodalis glossinidius str. 'morsitans']
MKTYRKTFSQRELMIIYPDFIAYNAQSGKNETVPATAYALGLRAKLDAEQGWHKSLSNVALDGVLGISADIWWSLQGKDTDASDLNAHHVTTLIKRGGFYTRTRTAQILADMIAEAHFSYMDKTLTPLLVKDVVDGINRKGMQLVTSGRLLGFSCWYDPADNPKETLREGQAHIRYKYTPVPPLESMGLIQTFTDEYFAVFNQLG